MSIVLRALAALLFIGIPGAGITQDEPTTPASLAADTSATFDYITENELPFFLTIEEFAHGFVDGKLARLGDLDVYEVFVRNGAPFAHPAVTVFARRLGQQYGSVEPPNATDVGCGKLMITKSWTLGVPVLKDDRKSLYSSGLLIDVEAAPNTYDHCSEWLELTLLTIERAGRADVSSKGRGYSVAVRVIEYEQWLIENTDYEKPASEEVD